MVGVVCFIPGVAVTKNVFHVISSGVGCLTRGVRKQLFLTCCNGKRRGPVCPLRPGVRLLPVSVR